MIWWRGGSPVVLGDRLGPEFLIEKFPKVIFSVFQRYITSGALDPSRFASYPVQDPLEICCETATYLRNTEKMTFENFSIRNSCSNRSPKITGESPRHQINFEASPPYRYAPPYDLALYKSPYCRVPESRSGDGPG